MHRLCVGPLALALIFSTGCLPQRARTPSGALSPVGVLVQATTGRCTSVLVGTAVHRVCLPRTAAPDTTEAGARPDTVSLHDPLSRHD